MAITVNQLRNYMDSIAKHIIDDQALIGSSSAILTGEATTLAQIAALNDQALEYALLDGAEAAMAAEAAWLTSEASYNAILDLYAPALRDIDKLVAGLGAWLTANTVQVDPHFLDAWNRAVSRMQTYPGARLAAFLAFGPAIANMGQINVTGATTGTFVAGTSVPAAYGNAPLTMFNAGAGNIGASTTSVTVTYSKYDNAGNLLTGQTVTVNMPSGTVPNGAVSLGVSGIAVTGITVTGGNNGDSIAVKSTLLRTVSY